MHPYSRTWVRLDKGHLWCKDVLDDMALVSTTAQLIRAISRVWQHKVGYFMATLAVFGLSVYGLAVLDLLPEAPAPTVAVAQVQATLPATTTPELPVAISIPSIKLSVSVDNPETTNVAKLDEALLHGAVRYPTSGMLGSDGNVIVFGHSSYLPIVNNKSFKAFNEIQKLTKGDQVLVSGTTQTYVYVVETVRQADAGTDAIPLAVTGQVLTLATCDSFGKSTDRFIVTAHFVESYPNAS